MMGAVMGHYLMPTRKRVSKRVHVAKGARKAILRFRENFGVLKAGASQM